MLTQHSKYVTPLSRYVKILTSAAIISSAITLVPMTAQASPGYENIVTKEYSAKFKREMFNSEAGIKQVYSALQKKAENACRLGNALNSDGAIISKAECVSDLLNQFIDSADVSVLTAYHMSREKLSG